MTNFEPFPIKIIIFKANEFKNKEKKRDMHLHKHATLEISYIVEGELILEYEDKKTGILKTRLLSAKDFFILLPNCLHRTFIPNSLKTLGVELITENENIFNFISNSRWVKSLPHAENFFHDFEDVKFLTDTHNVRYHLNKLNSYISQIEEIAEESDKDLTDLKTQSSSMLVNDFTPALYELDLKRLLIEILQCSITSGDTAHQTIHIRRAMSYIDSHFSQKISAEDIASVIGISKVYLQKLFHKEMHTSVQEYINNIRIKKAKSYIIHTNYSLKKISQMVGYHSVQSFIFNFKKQTAMTPSEYKIKEQHNTKLNYFMDTAFYNEYVL